MEENFIKIDDNFLNLPLIYAYLELGNDEIDSLVRILEKDDIIGNNPQKHLDKNQVICKLDLKDPNFILKSKKLEMTNKNR